MQQCAEESTRPGGVNNTQHDEITSTASKRKVMTQRKSSVMLLAHIILQVDFNSQAEQKLHDVGVSGRTSPVESAPSVLKPQIAFISTLPLKSQTTHRYRVREEWRC